MICEHDLDDKITLIRNCQRAFEVLTTQFRSAAHGRRQQCLEYTHVKKRAAVRMLRVKIGNPLYERLHPPQLRDGSKVGTVALNPARPNAAEVV